MDIRRKVINEEQIAELKSDIEAIIADIQAVRLSNNLSKMTQVRLVDLQYSAKLALDNLSNENCKEMTEDDLSNT